MHSRLLLALFTILLLSCSKKQQPSPPVNMVVHATGTAPMNLQVVLLTDDGKTKTFIYKNQVNTPTYDYSFHAQPGSVLIFDLTGPANVPLSISVNYNNQEVAVETNINFPDVNVVETGYKVPD